MRAQRTVQVGTVQVAAVLLLVLALLAGATYWCFRKSVPTQAVRQPRSELAGVAAAVLAQQIRDLRDQVEGLQQELDDANEKIQDLQAKAERREGRRDEPSVRSSPLPAREPAATPAPDTRSSMDLEQDKADFFAPALQRMAQGVARLSSLQDQYGQSCTGSMQMTYTDDFGNVQTGVIDRAQTPECLARGTAIDDLRSQLKSDAGRVEEAARRAGILPGILRGLVAKYHLGEYLSP